jgi:hypothetical protein
MFEFALQASEFILLKFKDNFILLNEGGGARLAACSRRVRLSRVR